MLGLSVLISLSVISTLIQKEPLTNGRSSSKSRLSTERWLVQSNRSKVAGSKYKLLNLSHSRLVPIGS